MRDQVSEQLSTLKEGMSLLTEAYTKAKEGMETYSKMRQADAEEQAEAIIAGAKRIEKEALSKHDEAEAWLKEVAIKEQKVEVEGKIVSMRTEELNALAIRLDEKREAISKERQVWEAKMAEYEGGRLVLEKEIGSLKEQRKTIAEDIVQATREAAIALQEAQVKNKQADEYLIDILNRQEVLMKKEAAVQEAQKLLADQRATLDRAVVEMRGKGANI
jgi:hypothetical protein